MMHALANLRPQLLRQGPDVVPTIAIGGEWHLFPADLQIPQPGAHREDFYLTPSVVDVVLTPDLETNRAQYVRQSRAIGRLPSMPHMQGAGGIGGHELNHHPLAAPEIIATVAIALLMHRSQLARVSVRREKEIDKASASYLGLRNECIGGQRRNDRLRKVTRITARGFGQAHGDIRREVSMLRVTRALDDDGSCCGRLGEETSGKPAQGGQHELFKLLLQGGAIPAVGWRRCFLEERLRFAGRQPGCAGAGLFRPRSAAVKPREARTTRSDRRPGPSEPVARSAVARRPEATHPETGAGRSGQSLR